MKKPNSKLRVCPNCGAALRPEDNYCPICGQETHSLHVPLKHLLLEFIEGLLHLDGKSVQTLKGLVFHPGQLTAEFRAGRRVRYVPPVRLYIFVSFVFFFLIAWNPGKHETDSHNKISLSIYSVHSEELEGLNEAQVDSLMQARGIEQTALNKYIFHQAGRIATGGRAEFNHLLLKAVTYMMFVLMPFFALLLLLAYRKSSVYFLDHMVFSIHFHTFAFLVFTVYFVLNWIVPTLILLAATPLILAVYLFLASKTVYCQRTGVILLKTLFIGASHLISLALLFWITALVSILVF